MMRKDADLPQQLMERLAGVRSVGAITGAGVSQESGIRTYRGSGGLYDDPLEGDRTIEALSGPTLRTDPDRTWRVLAKSVAQMRDAQPNPAHRALVEIEQRVERFVLLTQNVDGLHRLAGSRNIIDIHGEIFETCCMSCNTPGSLERLQLAELSGAPRCTSCGGVIRPNVVLFEEMLPQDKLSRLREEFFVEVPDLVISAGTSAPFQYIIEPVLYAQRMGKLTVEINPEYTTLTSVVDFHLRGKAGTHLPALAAALAG